MYQSNYGYYPTANNPGIRQTVAPQPAPQQFPMLKGRPVSSLEEARAMTIDFDGSMFFFPDVANKRIYTKQINMDGTASLNMYVLQDLPPEQPLNTNVYVTKEEFERVIQALRNSIQQPTQQPSPAPIKEPAQIPINF